jgi:gamma-glutamyltranspeptidase/glutathione hydrolase
MKAINFYFINFLLLLNSCSTSQKKLTELNPTLPITKNNLKKNVSEKNFVVASQGYFSAQAARKIYQEGGNLIDAFAAASFTAAVELPYSTGLGGGGFALFYHAPSKNVMAIDFREKAPHAVNSKVFLNSQGSVMSESSKTGGIAAGVPGLVAGVLEMHNLYGQLPRAKILEAAIELAEKGFLVTDIFAKRLKENAQRLSYYRGSRAVFFKADGQPYQKGDLFVQKDLAELLKKISLKGQPAFYRGDIALRIINYLKPNGGIMEFDDLIRYRAKLRKPIKGTFLGYEIYGMPPPSSGGILIQNMLNILENLNLSSDYKNLLNIHKTITAMQLAFADRNQYFGDTDFVKMPIEELLNKSYGVERSKLINEQKALKSEEIHAGNFQVKESNHTIHFSMADKEGNVISSTQTINGYFGNAMIIPGTGILMNNEMDDFSIEQKKINVSGAYGSLKNQPAPNKRPLSSMSPTLIFKNSEPVYALGSPAGTRIISCVLLSILNLLKYDMNLEKAIAAPRYHHQWQPDTLEIETAYKDQFNDLKKLGYEIDEWPSECSVQAVQLGKDTLKAVADPRSETSASDGF